jgi:hypothetical protein
MRGAQTSHSLPTARVAGPLMAFPGVKGLGDSNFGMFFFLVVKYE